MNRGVAAGCAIAGTVVFALAVCGGLVAWVVVSAVGTVASVGKPADEFLAHLGAGDTTGAYNSGASGLRANTTPEQFAAFVKSSRLDQYTASHWNAFNITNNQGSVEGAVTLKDGSSVPLKVNLVNEGGWKVLGVELTAAGVRQTPAARPSVPPEAELKALVNRDMAEFRQAVAADDFTRFHATLSTPFREQKTADELSEAFKSFRGKGELLNGVAAIDPTLTAPATLDADGVLKAEGEYPLRPEGVVFVAKYVSEKGEWKLLGLHLKAKPAG